MTASTSQPAATGDGALAGAPGPALAVAPGRLAPLGRAPWAPLLLAAACVLACSNTFGNKFVLDDNSIIVSNTMIRSLDRCGELFTSPYWGNQAEDKLYRPLTVLTYAIDRAWASKPDGDLDPWAFHFTNMLAHALATLALWLFLRRLLRGETHGDLAAAGAALLFAVHPVHTEAVTGIVGRAEVLCALFYFLAGVAWLRFREAATRASAAANYAACVACFALSLLCKEMGLPLPGVLFLCDLYRIARGRETAPRAQLLGRLALPQVGFLFVIFGYFVLRSAILGRPGPTATVFALYQTGIDVRLLTAFTVLADYVRLLFLPFGLRAEYSVNVVPAAFASWGDPWAWASIAFLGALAAGAVFSWRRAPVVTFAIGWFFLSIVPVSNVILPIGCIQAERFLYIPSVAGVLALAWLLGGLRGARAFPAAVCVLAVVGLAGTLARNTAWATEKALYADAIAKDPERNARAYSWLGSYYFAYGRYDDALAQYDRAIGIWDRYPQFYEARGRLHQARGKYEIALLDFDQAVQYAARLNRSGIPHPRMLHGRGSLLMEMRRFGDARADLEAAAALNPLDPLILNDLGALYLQVGEYDLAIQSFQRALEREPGNALAVANRGLALYRKKNVAGAIRDFRAAIALNKSLDTAYESLGVALYESGGDKAEAGTHLATAIQLAPERAAKAYSFLILCMLDLGKRQEAEAVVQLARKYRIPLSAEARERLGR